MLFSGDTSPMTQLGSTVIVLLALITLTTVETQFYPRWRPRNVICIFNLILPLALLGLTVLTLFTCLSQL